MQIRTYRGVPFIDREEEIEFFTDWFLEAPQRILFVYGPKSSGKTTVMEYVVENKLLNDDKYWVKYLNLRGKLISSYDSFLYSFITPDDIYKKSVETDKKFSLKFFSIQRKVLSEVKNKERDLFEELMKSIEQESRDKRCILIIDEIQKLNEIYINSNRELLKEFLNFCVRLTKETHLCHVLVLTSNTIFIEKIYSDAKLKKTSQFKKVDHLNRDKIKEWLIAQGFSDQEMDLVWDYYGGCVSDILKIISHKKKNKDIKEFLKQEQWLAYTEIVDFMVRGGFKDTEIVLFEEISKEILYNGCFELSKKKRHYLPVIEKWAEKEILFYDPLELKVAGNSRIYEKGMELVIG